MKKTKKSVKPKQPKPRSYSVWSRYFDWWHTYSPCPYRERRYQDTSHPFRLTLEEAEAWYALINSADYDHGWELEVRPILSRAEKADLKKREAHALKWL